LITNRGFGDKVEIKDDNGALLATVDMKDSAAAIRAIGNCVREHPPKSPEPETRLSGTGFFVAPNRVVADFGTKFDVQVTPGQGSTRP
jgi:hypothetical protein